MKPPESNFHHFKFGEQLTDFPPAVIQNSGYIKKMHDFIAFSAT